MLDSGNWTIIIFWGIRVRVEKFSWSSAQQPQLPEQAPILLCNDNPVRTVSQEGEILMYSYYTEV